ncbi:bifunctional indole-3-glycerol phosphate synthase/phosphoribosylanthranilate isomerase [Pseudoalteromonas haloplanktis]|uniref:bifunctional indole-3-glycerol-phosphate synthase TrpC/phosphoribosylanthranilate isomerase TrpF n=1 Tax=Pseudoalteromonas sp. S1612 TaxID=579507 RepID=UPI000948EE2A|nr:bifunctional indole-3-glycerol-phosphate synthase TrpC/phosphoribosylanthranilate isomerase TrpF [Pseudoalteromonas sp. S1612]OLF80020.1 bifunctional indole-3-glycerol phosphate synthase/phosphoribosylanthranilate isomerase [Pseudoalteromonas haloplanktis]TMP53556.1 bifunctional indole-3-glycerol-phosphate synthase TrpC/phosphoribosylanthranilate isomerase TrpF [Pseudoalteromonas sp. S1612]
MANVLDKIIADKKIELIERKAARPLESFKHQAKPTERSFYKALAAPGTQFILECKKASPSKGLIRQPFDLTEITQAYKQYATCMSVLTDEKYFQGSFDYLEFVRSQVQQPLICKDFFIDEYQVYMARIYGGDAILLMLSVLDDQQYKTLHEVADSLNMSVLTEVSNEEEVHRALALNAQIIGINNRDLRDLSTDLATTERLRKLIPENKVVISESGIYTHQDVKRLAPLCNGFLIGSSLMAEADLLQACRRVILGENKVCGLTRNQDAIAAYSNGAVYGGLIFYPKSPRFVDLDCAKEISQSAPLKFVGVFVNAAIPDVAEHAKQLKLSAVQLHGQEDEQYIASLRSELPRNCQIWKAQAIKNVLPQPVAGADRHLYDTHSDSHAGGTGKTFDWLVLRDATTPFMLAGGLNPDNISDALYHGALGLDLNSGVEQSPGKKCAKKLNHAFSSIRNY